MTCRGFLLLWLGLTVLGCLQFALAVTLARRLHRARRRADAAQYLARLRQLRGWL